MRSSSWRRRGALVAAFSLLAAGCMDWPMLGHDNGHSGVAPEQAINASNASTLDVAFEGNAGHDMYASPSVVWDAAIGKRLIIVGNNTGTITAFDEATNDIVWTFQTRGAVVSTATVVDGVAYVGSNDHNLYALDVSTGALRCSFDTGGQVQASPLVVDPDGTGRVVYFGDNGDSGGDDGGHFWALDAVDPNPAPDCSVKWSYDQFGDPPGSQPLVGSWSPPGLTHDVNGRPLVVFGSSSPEGAVYALDASTGARVWRYLTAPAPDGDVGGGATISEPGFNGFADGVVYLVGKDWYVYALDGTTGAEIWHYDVKADSPGLPGALRNTPALDGNTLYVSYPAGVYAFNAQTGAKLWKTQDRGYTTAEIFSSPALAGPAGDKVIVVGDQGGTIYGISAADGSLLWHHTTDGSVLSSAAYANGRVYIADTDGTVYGFAPGGAPAGSPDTTITSPADGQAVANPNGPLTFTGTATDDTGVASVGIALRDVNTGNWWNGSTSSWVRVPVQNPATLANPGASSTGWSYAFPAPYNGGRYELHARAVDFGSLPDASRAVSSFAVTSLGSPPSATITSPNDLQTIIIPNHTDTGFTVSLKGSATDSGGANPGVAHVWLTVRVVEHAEYFCGFYDCSGYGWPWVAAPASYEATLSNPNATTTSWSSDVTVYGHAHTYAVTAWAVDRDGQVQQARPTVTFCTNFQVAECPLQF